MIKRGTSCGSSIGWMTEGCPNAETAEGLYRYFRDESCVTRCSWILLARSGQLRYENELDARLTPLHFLPAIGKVMCVVSLMSRA